MHLTRILFIVPSIAAAPVLAQSSVVQFEGDSFPELQGWTREIQCDPQRQVQDGWYVQNVQVGGCFAPPGGDQDRFRYFLDDFDGAPDFFAWWRVLGSSDRSEIIGAAPAQLVLGGIGPANYSFVMARDRMRLLRDVAIGLELFVDLEADVPHTYYLEIYSDSAYSFWIDHELINEDVPGGAFPADIPQIGFRANVWFEDAEVRWDFVRFGRVPVAGSGDFNSDGLVNENDRPIFEECLAGGKAGGACKWADMTADGIIDCLDADTFRSAWFDPANPPTISACPAPIPAVSHWGAAVLILLVCSVATLVYAPKGEIADSKIGAQNE